MKLTFVTWNLRNGGIDPGSGARLRRQLAVLAGLRPAVAALQECKHWDRGYWRTFHLAEQALQMRGSWPGRRITAHLRLRPRGRGAGRLSARKRSVPRRQL